MEVPKELQILTQAASEIDESEIKIIFANQCIKAQESLASKLKEEIQRRKEICIQKKSENSKLEAEIQNAEVEIDNLRITYEAIKKNNVEINKELLLTKEKKTKLAERVKKGEKEYEELWIQCKERYENMPLVKTLTKSKNKCNELRNAINVIDIEAKNINSAIKTKKEELAEKDRKQIVCFAQFIIHEVPAAVKIIKDKSAMIKKLTEEIDDITKQIKAKEAKIVSEKSAKEAKKTVSEDKKASKNTWTIDNTPMMPKLQLPSVDLDLGVKLDLNKVTLHTSPIKKPVSLSELENTTFNKTKISKPDEMFKDNYISCYFNKPTTDEYDMENEDSTVNYSKKKLINIIENIKIDDNETYKLVANTNINDLQEVDLITASRKTQDFIKSASAKNSQPMEIEEVEEVEMTTNEQVQQEFLNPPTQFLDPSQENSTNVVKHTVQAEIHVDGTKPSEDLSPFRFVEDRKKKVSFDLTAQTLEESGKLEESVNVSATSQLDLSDVTDDNYMAIKDMILKKKHQLDLSPQFVYAKSGFQKKNEEQTVTSKFFNDNQNLSEKNMTMENKNSDNGKDENIDKAQEANSKSPTENIVSMDVDNAVSDGPEAKNLDQPLLSGLLFTHGPQGVTDLDISISTTGYDDGDPDFPTCLDSSLLLSPKADIPPMSASSDAGSQDLPGFLTGFRKAGLSFFKQNPADANENPDTNKPNSENNFSFNFGSDDKKPKGGLFSFFR